MDTSLTRNFERDGFAVLPGFASESACTRLRARAREIVAGEAASAPVSVFDTGGQSHAADQWFATSGDKVRAFYEPGTVREDGTLSAQPWTCVNKLGHALHDLDPEFDAFSRDPRLAAVVRDLGRERTHLVQSMYLAKQARVGEKVDWHQDACFLVTEPASCIGLWFALEDATVDNGCLMAIPGGHLGPLRKRFVRDGEQLSMRTLDETPLATERAVPVEVEAGSLVVLHGLLPHASGPNPSARSREAYAVHVVDADAVWAQDNWLTRGAHLPFRGFDVPTQEGIT